MTDKCVLSSHIERLIIIIGYSSGNNGYIFHESFENNRRAFYEKKY
jgi:hypothetical protein